jgi:TolB-like protein
MDFLRRARLFQRVLGAGILLLALTPGAYAQAGKLGAIAILPFTGGSGTGEQNGIPERVAFTNAVNNNFSRVLLRTDIARDAEWEQTFQHTSGMIKTADAVTLGKNAKAEYVMTGSITALGEQKLLIVAIINLQDIRQVAGSFILYKSMNEFTRDASVLNNLADSMVRMIRDLDEDLPPLAVMPVRIENGTKVSEGDAMAQILAIHLLREGKWAVCPRMNIESLQAEYEEQLKSGSTREGQQLKAGAALVPRHILSVASRTYGGSNTFNGTITNLEGGGLYDGANANYEYLEDGIYVMESLARNLSKKGGAIAAGAGDLDFPAEKLGAIAVLPFTGGASVDEQNGIPERIAMTNEMVSNFGNVMLRTDLAHDTAWEQAFQRGSGMIKPEDAVAMGKNAQAEYVMTGSITALGHQKLLIVSIINIHDVRQVAGDFLLYNSIDEFSGNTSLLNNMAGVMARMIRNMEEDLPPLAVMPVRIEGGGVEDPPGPPGRQSPGAAVPVESLPRVSEGDALAQILSIYLTREGKWAVCPRTDLDKVQAEAGGQGQGGPASGDPPAGTGLAPRYSLAVVSRTYGSAKSFNAIITNLEDGTQHNGGSVPYGALDDGLLVMEPLAQELSGKEGAIQAALAAVDQSTFLKNSGIAFQGWTAMTVGGSSVSSDGSTVDAFRGGLGLELRFYNFGIQTGINTLSFNIPYTPPDEEDLYAEMSTTQIPLLLRFNFWGPRKRGSIGAGLSVFGGLGFNLSANTRDTVVVDPAPVGLIIGGGVEWYGYHFSLALGYQYNGDLGDSTLTVGRASYPFNRNIHMLGFSLAWYIPFRRSQ